MYIWIGCKLPECFEQDIRQKCLSLNEGVGLSTVAFSLPQHISLKISFTTERPDAVLADLTHFLMAQTAFTVQIKGIEQTGNILWMSVAENKHLQQLHEQLDAHLSFHFGITQHEFDKCFLFHSTLFMDSNPEKIAKMAELLAGHMADQELCVNTFLLGVSETGKPGDYRIVREIII